MKQSDSPKSLAWFKLAEFVQRGEKERALGIYKLLALSLENLAFAYQLEGDILLAFDDQDAKGKYFQAVEIYLNQHNIMAATGILNHLVLLEPTNLTYWQKLTEIYCEHYSEKASQLIKNMVNCGQIRYAQESLKTLIYTYQQKQLNQQLKVFIAELENINIELYLLSQTLI